jgi:hypothetical protein
MLSHPEFVLSGIFKMTRRCDSGENRAVFFLYHNRSLACNEKQDATLLGSIGYCSREDMHGLCLRTIINMATVHAAAMHVFFFFFLFLSLDYVCELPANIFFISLGVCPS